MDTEISMIGFRNSHDYDATEELDFLLRRAEQELIAAIRSINAEVAERHDAMAHAYSAMAIMMIDRRDQAIPTIVEAGGLGKDARAVR